MDYKIYKLVFVFGRYLSSRDDPGQSQYEGMGRRVAGAVMLGPIFFPVVSSPESLQ